MVERPSPYEATRLPLNQMECGSRCTDTVACRAGSNAAKADVIWEETGGCTRGTAGVWVHASGERGAERTPGSCATSAGKLRVTTRRMKGDPSQPACRGRLQTTSSCLGQKPWW